MSKKYLRAWWQEFLKIDEKHQTNVLTCKEDTRSHKCHTCVHQTHTAQRQSKNKLIYVSFWPEWSEFIFLPETNKIHKKYIYKAMVWKSLDTRQWKIRIPRDGVGVWSEASPRLDYPRALRVSREKDPRQSSRDTLNWRDSADGPVISRQQEFVAEYQRRETVKKENQIVLQRVLLVYSAKYWTSQTHEEGGQGKGKIQSPQHKSAWASQRPGIVSFPTI